MFISHCLLWLYVATGYSHYLYSSYSKQRSYCITPKLRKIICKPLVSGSHHVPARRCLKDSCVNKYILKGIGMSLQHEIASIMFGSCKLSPARQKCEYIGISDTLLHEVKTWAPTLFSILEAHTYTRRARPNCKAVVGMIVAILCKHRQSSASLLQRLVSIVLYSGHSSKCIGYINIILIAYSSISAATQAILYSALCPIRCKGSDMESEVEDTMNENRVSSTCIVYLALVSLHLCC